FDTKSNPNLCCIAVNDPVYCTANYSSFKDPTTIFGSDCAMTLIPDPNFEQALIDLNIDSDNTINGKVLTSDIDWISILDVSNKNISDLTGIEDFASLILLSCANNNLTSIDVSNNSLQGIYCDFNSLSVLDLSNQNGIEYIDCSNNQLTSLLLGNSGEDVRLRCNNNMLSTLNVTGYYLMDVLECSNNQIQSLDLSNNVDITRIIANNNNLSELLLYNNNFDNMSIGTVDFNTTSNPNLFCIEVENAAWSTTNWINVDSQTSFSENCTLDVIADNDPDENINLALLEDATLSGSVSNGRGTPQAILYDPLIEDYSTRTNWNEYGVGFGDNLGRPDADNGFKWQVDWPTTKAINYVTFGGVYYNQPQPNALWRISYLNNDQWMTLDEGQGGWVDSGIYEWDGTAAQAITADALRVQIYSDGETDLVSIHLRGRGGISNRINDSGTETKATLIQYLPPVGSPIADFNAVTNVLNVDFDASNSSDNNTIVDYQWNFGDGYATNSTSVVTTHTYLQSGTYLVTLKIIDNDGLTDIVSKTVTVSDGTAINEPDENINLALLEDANLSGSVGSGRGTLEAILYDPSIDDYFVRTDYNEYGVGFGENLGRPEADNGFFWQVDWSVPKSINYITFGGTYNNQPQPNAMWRISYLNNEDWITLDEGQGGWIDSGIYEWDGTASPAITAEALRVQIYSDGNTDLKSIHLRGRGGLSYRINDTNTATKATLIQYLPASTNVTVLRNEKPVDIMKLSPNPATSNVTLSFTVTTEVEVIEVSDLTGRLVSRFKGGKIDKEGIQISVKGLPIGVYNVKATSTTGEIYPVKLIKI
ncbi:PKD domain-containing protein, partial [Winogradskyella eximia]|uniref:PKD domain-containing protein n=1 Tax=Winogradskyella eximia TaxID=262006 RepID=UPI000E21D9C0